MVYRQLGDFRPRRGPVGGLKHFRFPGHNFFLVFNTVTKPSLYQFVRNPEPIGTHFLGSDLEPGTHRNPLRANLPGTRNPPEPIFLKLEWVPPGTPEPMGSWVPLMPTPAHITTNVSPRA